MTTQTCQKTITRIDANPLLQSRSNANRTLNVAAYCRVSTDSEDQLSSYEAQVAYYTDYISKNPKWRFAGIYADEGITGTMVKNRTRFNQMIKDSEKGKIDLILTKSVSRFARNTVDSLSYVRRLKAKGIGVFFEEQNCNSLEEDSEMYIGIYSVIAQTESENISANVRWGIQQRMKNGTFAFRYNLLGYRKGENGEPEIVPEEAVVIRKIFSMYLDGNSTNQIKEYLESNHILTKTGKTIWDRRIIRNILDNEKYAGDMLMQKTFRVDCISKKTRKNNGEKAKYLITNNHPEIIDRDTFKMVQAERARRIGKRKVSDRATTELGKYSGKYALTELLICGECGSPYRRKTIISHGEKKIYWRCLNRIEHGTVYCKDSVGVEESKLHEAICSALSAALPDRVEVLNAIKSTLGYAVTGDEHILNAYNIELNIKQYQEDATELMKLLGKTEGDTERYENEIAKIYEKIKILREQLAIAKAQSERSNNANNEIIRLTDALEKDSLNFEEFDDSVVRRVVECMRVMRDKSIIITLKGGIELYGKIK